MKTFWPALVVLTACGGGSSQTPDAPASIDATPDAGPFAEAPHDDPPQVTMNGGPVMASVKVVPIFFQGDSSMQTQVEGFLTAVVGSSWWTATTSEYGIGAISVQTTIVSSDPPPTTDDALQAWIAAHAGTSPWPAPDANTVYAVFLPSGASLSTPFGDSCSSFGGYHDEGMMGSTKFIYALLPRCTSDLDSLSVATSHELVEAATDPYPFTNGAYQLVDDAHLIWEFTPGGELGDMCEYVGNAAQRLVGAYAVQRTWSNASAMAGHDPCVPVMSTPYLASAPVLPEMLGLDPMDGTGLHMTKGVQIAMGTSKTIEVDLFSDGPVTADWTIKAIDANSLSGSPPELGFSWDSTTGHNGDKRQLTITRSADGQGGGSEFVISTRVDNHSVSLWWGYVAN